MQFAWLEVGSGKVALSRLTYQPSSGCCAIPLKGHNANRWALICPFVTNSRLTSIEQFARMLETLDIKGECMKNRLLFTFVFPILIALLVASVVGAAPKDGPIVALSVTQGKFASSEDVLVTVTIFNPTKNTVKVLRWFTPEDQTAERLFAVTRNGEPVAYTGPVYKRVPATEQ